MTPTLLLGSLVLFSTTAYAANDLSTCVMTGVAAQPARIVATGSEIKKAINVCKKDDTVKCMAQISNQIGRWGQVAGDIAQMVAKCGDNSIDKDNFKSCGTNAVEFVANVGILISSTATLSDDCDGSDSDSGVDSDDESASPMELAVCTAGIISGGSELYDIIDMIMKAKDDCNSTNVNMTGGGAKCAAEILGAFNGGAAAIVSISTALVDCTGVSHPMTTCALTVSKFIESATGLASSASGMAKDCNPKGSAAFAKNSVMTRFDMGLKQLSTLAALKNFRKTEDKSSLAITVLVVLAAFASVTLIGFAARKALRNPVRRVAAQDPESEQGLVAETE